MINRKWTISLILLGVLILGSYCGGKKVEEMNYEKSSSEKIILASIRGSEFKQLIIKELANKYKEKYSVDVINLDEYDQIENEEFDVIVLMDENQAWMRFNGKLKDIAQKVGKEKAILFVTAGDPDWELEYKDFDTVSCASEPENVSKITEEIAGKIDAILENSE